MNGPDGLPPLPPLNGPEVPGGSPQEQIAQCDEELRAIVDGMDPVDTGKVHAAAIATIRALRPSDDGDDKSRMSTNHGNAVEITGRVPEEYRGLLESYTTVLARRDELLPPGRRIQP